MSDTTPKRRFFSSTTLERAVLEAAGHYGLEPEELAYTKLEKTGVGARGKVSIKVDPASPRKVEATEAAASTAADSVEPTPEPAVEILPAPDAEDAEDAVGAEAAPGPQADEDAGAETGVEVEASEAEAEADDAEGEGLETDETDEADEPSSGGAAGSASETPEPSTVSDEMTDLPRTSAEARRGWQQASGPVEQAARKWTESLLRVASLDLDVEIYERDGELDIHLGGSDAEVAVEDGGEVLRAMQHLLPRLMLGTTGDSVHCRVDCNDFRELHEERLRAQALNAAAEAMADRGEVTLDPMHPADRRIVHLALADNERVRTESLGRGFFKRVSIRGN